ncbi:PREDICTED: SH3 domain and tetratricopeptide repeat-containing protein 2-like [Tinamus guttatus]|uniref:SH3 domain and tetratricopeptide repeat-containing protein 2-like n=1 Tax=Tinamus guttatus TaxID=94827 RepID=UPI00052EB250|nr:PREDICTED: SH3 domain and tetratricopeptide repeat-containing protein 2-like [Tinamus guttatus]
MKSCSRCLNSQLQEAVRKKLWALENDDREVCALFKELSARLVCVQAQEDRFLLTFKTLEEIWKFSTYLTLGYVSKCLEQLLFDQIYWLNCALMEDTEIKVTVNEDRLATIYLGLLLQEGNFFSRAVPTVCQTEEEREDGLKFCSNELMHVKNIGDEFKWEGMSLLTGQRGLVPVTALEPVPQPFYQWFLKNHVVNFGISQEISGTTSQTIVKGSCTAKEDHRGETWNELSFSKGDSIEVIGFLIPGLPWFVGKSQSNGNIGFVPTTCINPEACEPLGKGLEFLSEEEKVSLLRVPCNGNEQHFTTLLSDLACTDITSLYRLGFLFFVCLLVCVDGFEPTATFPKVPPEAVLQSYKDIQLLQSWEEINSFTTPSTSEKSSPGNESAPTTLEDIFLEKSNDFDDPKFFIDLNVGHMEDADVFDPILTFLNQSSYVPNFQSLYDLSFSFLSSTFYGFSDEDELVLYLETCRNWAKRTHSAWAHIRLCFLLGKLCIKKVKFSQARVYFEEAMSILDMGFGDLPLMAALHVNLASIYLKQNMKNKFSSLLTLPYSSRTSRDLPSAVPYKALNFSRDNRAVPTQRTLCAILSRMYLQHDVLDGAVCYAATAVALSRMMSEEEAFESSLYLGWMYLLDSQPGPAAEIMWQLLHSLHGTDSVTQGGAVHNLLAIALKGEGQVQKAAENYLRALYKAKETGNKRNQAITLANLGQLSLSHGAKQLSEIYLLQSAELYAELQGTEDLEMELGRVLLWLAQAMINRQRIEDGKLCYELALLFALKWHNVRSQLHITESLCHFYSKVSPNLQACITYHEHCVSLAQQLRDREMEGNIQQALSQLYQALDTSKALKQSLDCTKQSLRIFIDLGETVKAAEAWLQAGRLYYLLQEDELVEMYFQAAIQTAVKSGDFCLAMDLYEKAGDTFFNGSRNRDRAVEYYRGGAVPLARKLKAIKTELRLFNKLAELQIGLQGYEKALEFATLAARLSTRVGDQLQERVAFHRLATVYYFLQMYEMAEDCYLKTLALHSPLLQCAGEALYYSKVYCHLGNLTLHKLKDEQDAAGYFLLALAAATEVGDQELQGNIHAKLGRIYSAPLCHVDTPGCTMYRARWLSEGGHVV